MAPKTNSERQQARRLREKQWLVSHGFTSWEQLHTQLMNNKKIIIPSPGIQILPDGDFRIESKPAYEITDDGSLYVPPRMKGKQS